MPPKVKKCRVHPIFYNVEIGCPNCARENMIKAHLDFMKEVRMELSAIRFEMRKTGYQLWEEYIKELEKVKEMA